MLQRIQSLYLLIVLILCSLNAFLPIAEFASSTEVYQLGISGLKQIITDSEPVTIEHVWVMAIILIIIPLISLITVNLFKRRMLQIRLTVFNSLLMLGYYGLFFYFRYYFITKYNCEAFFTWTIILPLISIILNYLAIRAIGKDEALVQSLNRIR